MPSRNPLELAVMVTTWSRSPRSSSTAATVKDSDVRWPAAIVTLVVERLRELPSLTARSIVTALVVSP